MAKKEFAYTTFIKSTPEKIWNAITNPEFTRQYWRYENISSDWKKGSAWKHTDPATNTIFVGGKVLESNPPSQLVLSWIEPQNETDISQVSFEIVAETNEIVRLTVLHTELSDYMAGRISGGWPRVLSNMKSLLETGQTIDIWSGKGSCNTSKAA